MIANSQWNLVEAHGRPADSAPFPLRRKQAQDAAVTPIYQQVLSWLLFWPLLTLLARHPVYFSGPAVTAEGYQNGAAMSGPRGSHYSFYVTLLFMLGFVLVGNQLVWGTLKKNWLIVAMLALAACSVFWSATVIGTLQMCLAVSLCTLFACYLSARYTTDRLMQLLTFVGVPAALVSVLFALALPSYGIFRGYGGGAWQGICSHKNSLGLSMTFLLTPVFFTERYSRNRKLLYSALLLFLIYKSQSRGAWGDAVGMLLFVACLGLIRKVRTKNLPLVLLIMAMVSVMTLVLGLHFWPLIAKVLGKNATMTGRTGIYAEVWRSILKRPLFGYGMGGFWYPGNAERQRIAIAASWPNIGYAENGFLELALQIGFVGVGLVVAMMAKAIVQGIRLLRSPNYTPRVGWFLTILFLVALTNIDAGWFMTSDTLDWVLVIVACVGMNEEASLHRNGVYSG